MPSRKDKFKLGAYGVGYIGVGDHSSVLNGKRNPAYVTWYNMIKRCYSGCYPTYSECYVCDEWLNFQNFANWYFKEHPNDGEKYDLDKDIKKDGNKIYCPEFCQFTSKQKNIEKSRSKSYSFISPSGEVFNVYNLSKFCREKGLHNGHMSQVAKGKLFAHKGWSVNPENSEYSKLQQEQNS